MEDVERIVCVPLPNHRQGISHEGPKPHPLTTHIQDIDAIQPHFPDTWCVAQRYHCQIDA